MDISINELNNLNTIIDCCNGFKSLEKGFYKIVAAEKINNMNSVVVRKYTDYETPVFASYDIVIRPNVVTVEKEVLCGSKSKKTIFEICKYKEDIVVLKDGNPVTSYYKSESGQLKIRTLKK